MDRWKFWVGCLLYPVLFFFPDVTSAASPFEHIEDCYATMHLSTNSFPEMRWEGLSSRTTLPFLLASTTWDSLTSPAGNFLGFLRYAHQPAEPAASSSMVHIVGLHFLTLRFPVLKK